MRPALTLLLGCVLIWLNSGTLVRAGLRDKIKSNLNKKKQRATDSFSSAPLAADATAASSGQKASATKGAGPATINRASTTASSSATIDGGLPPLPPSWYEYETAESKKCVASR